jgi:hypothetical protein
MTAQAHAQYIEDKTFIANVLAFISDWEFKVTSEQVARSKLPARVVEEAVEQGEAIYLTIPGTKT